MVFELFFNSLTVQLKNIFELLEIVPYTGCFSFDQMVQFVFRKFQVANQTAFTRIFFNFRDLAARNVLIHEDGTAKVCHVL